MNEIVDTKNIDNTFIFLQSKEGNKREERLNIIHFVKRK
jgi:hypothetical protein